MGTPVNSRKWAQERFDLSKPDEVRAMIGKLISDLGAAEDRAEKLMDALRTISGILDSGK